jgi:hypothetical protein
MTALLAGRAAEEIVYVEVSTGAADDLAKATDVACQSVTFFGMNDTVGQAVLEEERQQWLGDGGRLHPKDYFEASAREIDLAVRGDDRRGLCFRQQPAAFPYGRPEGWRAPASGTRDDYAGRFPAASATGGGCHCRGRVGPGNLTYQGASPSQPGAVLISWMKVERRRGPNCCRRR